MAFEGLSGLGSAAARAGNFTPGTGSCVAAAAEAGSEGREFPIQFNVGRGWVPAPASARRGWVHASACPRRAQGVRHSYTPRHT